MITLNHGLSGYVCGRVVMPLLKRRSPLSERAMGWAFFLGAMLPDVDILTRLVGRPVYFADAWYAHRHASHSILGTLTLAALVGALLLRLFARSQARARGRAYAWLVGCLWCGGLLHILGDLYTPGWPLPVLWPWPGTYGALRHIGWFSPYLLWLFLATLAFGWAAGALPWRWPSLRRWEGLRRWAPPRALRNASVWLLYCLAAYRWIDFMLTSRYESWSQWEAYHLTLLPEAMIFPVTRGIGLMWRFLTG